MITALILSGGTGTRIQSTIPKQYIEIGGFPIISYCLRTLSLSEEIDALWIVADEKWQEQILSWLPGADPCRKFRGFSKPGMNRQLSVYNGLVSIRRELPDTEYVLVHDAARPLLHRDDISSYIKALDGYDGVMPVLPMKDTVYLSEDGVQINSLLERSHVYRGQAPELFALDQYLSANEQLIRWSPNEDGSGRSVSPASPILGINGSTEPAVIAGMRIAMVPGNEENFKITTQADLERFEEITKRSKR